MALKYQKQKNLVRSPDEYTRYYGNFRGVDFSSDHTEVHEQRLAYSINMYKDYRTGEGNAVETIPGFRRRFVAPRTLSANNPPEIDKIKGIHAFEYIKADGERDLDIIVHAGKYLYLWDNYPYSVNVVLKQNRKIGDDLTVDIDFYCYKIDSVEIEGVKKSSGLKYTKGEDNKGTLHLAEDEYSSYKGKDITVCYYEGEKEREKDAFYSEMTDSEDSESKSFVFNNRLYILDGKQFLVYYKNNDNGGFSIRKVDKSEGNYIPTTYRNLGVGAIAPEELSKYEYEQKNLLCDYFKHTYVADGATTDYILYDDDDVYSVAVNDVTLKEEEYSVAKGKITFNTAPTIPNDKPDTYAGVEVTFKKKTKTEKGQTIYSADLDKAKINNCTICATFDKRIFLTGNPEYPNHIWYCGINNTTGYEDAAYFGELDYVIDGVENAPITGLIPVGDTLAALKNHTRQDGSVYFHTRLETNAGVIPVTYPSEPGLSGIGCLGACVNFLDDPIFISRLGAEGISKLNLKSERSIEHRSSLIDAKLVNLNLSNARLAEWDGYLVLLVDGKIFLADSRQRYVNDIGVNQYEWYYLEEIGIYEDQREEYYYAHEKYSFIPDTITKDEITYPTDIATHIYNADFSTSENLLYTAVKEEEESLEFEANQVFHIVIEVNEGTENDPLLVDYGADFIIRKTWDGKTYNANGTPALIEKAIFVENYGSFTGGTFYPAKKIVNIDENIFFGTDNGIVCSFNFDKKNDDGTISPIYYSFDNRTIYCGIATKMDNCGIPHLTKSTIKKSTVIKTKSMIASAAKVRVRTNNNGYASVARINNRVFSFDDLDFSDFSFVSKEQTIFAVKEKEKHWVEKQHWIYSDEYQRPFSVHYLAFRYKVSGRIKK